MPQHKTSAMVLSLLLLLAGPGCIRAQEPGQEPSPEPTPEPDKWASEIGLALNGSGGNESLTVLVTELSLRHLQTESYELTMETRFRYGRSEGDEVANHLRGSVTADFWPDAGWSPFLFAQAERDPFRKIRVRLNSGSGIKRTFYREGWSEVSLSGAVLYDFENTTPDPELGNGRRQTARWSWRGRARRELSRGTRVDQIVFFQPAWNHVRDYRLEARSSMRVALTESLAFTTTGTYLRDSTPAPNVGPDDWNVSVGLSLALGW